MLKIFRENVFAAYAIGVLLAYILVNAIVTPIDIRILVAFLLTFFAILHCSSWAVDAMKVFRSGITNPEHLALFGLWLVSLGCAWTGIYSMSWNFFGRQIEWTQYPISVIYPAGPLFQSIGFMILSFVPMNKSVSVRSPSFLIYLVCAISLVAFGYISGATSSEPLIPQRPSFLR